VSAGRHGEQGKRHVWERQLLRLVEGRASLSAQAALPPGCAPCRAPRARGDFPRGRLTLTAGLCCAGFPSGEEPLFTEAIGWLPYRYAQIFIVWTSCQSFSPSLHSYTNNFLLQA